MLEKMVFLMNDVDAGVSGNDFRGFGNRNGNRKFYSQTSGMGRELKKTHSLSSGTGRERKKPFP